MFIRSELIIIGGAEDKTGESNILEYITQCVGGGNANIVIITTATEKPKQTYEAYENVFKKFGVKNLYLLDIKNRKDANIDENADKLSNASCIFFTGGDQLRITSIIGGTKVYQALQKACSNGVLIAGTSAGAAAMSSTMIIGGNGNDPARKCSLNMAPGLSLIEGAIIDQHFHQRGRIGRLLCAVASNPSVLGIGIDEDTAIHVSRDGIFKVIGNNTVTIIDGNNIQMTNVSELYPEELLAVSGAVIHVITKGYVFDMKSRQVISSEQIIQIYGGFAVENY